MRFGLCIAAAALAVLVALPADAQTRRATAVNSRGQTVFVSRDENGRTRTRVIIQKRSYLDPGTESFPGEQSGHEYATSLTRNPTDSLSYTAGAGYGYNREALPGPFTLPGKNNPWIGY